MYSLKGGCSVKLFPTRLFSNPLFGFCSHKPPSSVSFSSSLSLSVSLSLCVSCPLPGLCGWEEVVWLGSSQFVYTDSVIYCMSVRRGGGILLCCSFRCLFHFFPLLNVFFWRVFLHPNRGRVSYTVNCDFRF